MHCLHHGKHAVQNCVIFSVNKVNVNGDLLNKIGFESAQRICKKEFGLRECRVVLNFKCRD